jgi:hypothetical protein
MWIDPGYGYHVDNTSGLATGAEEESIYAVMSGTHYNQHCCFVRASSASDGLRHSPLFADADSACDDFR